MKKYKFTSHKLAILSLLGLGCFGFGAIVKGSGQPDSHSYGSEESTSEATMFGEGTISTGDFEFDAAFSPDGNTIYFTKSTPNFGFWTIVVSHLEGGKWSQPEVAEFSGRYSDADPFVSPDGSKLYFISNRPVNDRTKKVFDIWIVEKTPTGWSEPKNLGAPVNTDEGEYYPAVTSDATLYFCATRPGGKGKTDLYRSRFVQGKYAEPENLGDAINSQFTDCDAYISPDESFLILTRCGHPNGQGKCDLYVSYNRNGKWTQSENLGDNINSSAREFCPNLSPDGKYFFFTSDRGFGEAPQEKRLTYQELLRKLGNTRNGLGDIYRIDIRALNLER